ncbi:MAG: DoxX family protein [Chloroflexota bacterium]
MTKRETTIYWIAVAIFALMIIASIILPFLTGSYIKLGYPPHLMYLLPIYKILGLTAIFFDKSEQLSEWAYAGFTFLLILAIYSHLMVADNLWAVPMIPLAALGYMYYYKHQLKVGHS